MDELRRETREDGSLEAWRSLADRKERGFSWRDGLLVKHELDMILIVLPTKYRSQVLKLAHDHSGHYSWRKVLVIVRRSFVWPLMTTHIKQYYLSCENCQRMARSGPKRAPMISREIKSVPFEDVAIDLVGPFEKGRGGCRYLLTYICMASSWPEAISLKSVTARAVADGLLEIFCRNGIPLQMLSDQGNLLTGALMSELCVILGVVKI